MIFFGYFDVCKLILTKWQVLRYIYAKLDNLAMEVYPRQSYNIKEEL